MAYFVKLALLTVALCLFLGCLPSKTSTATPVKLREDEQVTRGDGRVILTWRFMTEESTPIFIFGGKEFRSQSNPLQLIIATIDSSPEIRRIDVIGPTYVSNNGRPIGGGDPLTVSAKVVKEITPICKSRGIEIFTSFPGVGQEPKLQR